MDASVAKKGCPAERGPSGVCENTHTHKNAFRNVGPFVNQDYDLNEMVEGGEYEDEKRFDPLGHLETKNNPYGLDANIPNGVDFYAKLSELNLKQGTLDYEDELEENVRTFVVSELENLDWTYEKADVNVSKTMKRYE